MRVFAHPNTNTLSFCSCRNPDHDIMVYQSLISRSSWALKGCFVFLRHEPPRSHRYLPAMRICLPPPEFESLDGGSWPSLPAPSQALYHLRQKSFSRLKSGAASTDCSIHLFSRQIESVFLETSSFFNPFQRDRNVNGCSP